MHLSEEDTAQSAQMSLRPRSEVAQPETGAANGLVAASALTFNTISPSSGPVVPGTSASTSDGALTWGDLTETEKSAASLGVDPNAYKPIEFMNTAHYNTLLQTNAIDGELAKKLEAYKVVASGASAP